MEPIDPSIYPSSHVSSLPLISLPLPSSLSTYPSSYLLTQPTHLYPHLHLQLVSALGRAARVWIQHQDIPAVYVRAPLPLSHPSPSIVLCVLCMCAHSKIIVIICLPPGAVKKILP